MYLVGHIPPGSDERQRNPGADERQRGPVPIAYSSYHNRYYLQLVRKYADTIVGQFFGHLHSDSFRVMYSEQGKQVPLSVPLIMLQFNQVQFSQI